MKKMIIRKAALMAVIGWVATATASFAQEASKTAAMESSVIPRNPASLALGGVSALSGGNAWAAFENVAAPAFSQQSLDIALSTQIWNPSGTSSNLYGGGVSYTLNGKLGIAAAFSLDRGEAYPVYDASGKTQGDYTPSDMQAGFGVSYRFLDFLSAGVGLKYMKSSLSSDYSLSAIAFDAMLNAEFDGLSASAGVMNIGGKAGDYDLPASVRAAAAYKAGFAEKHAVKAGAQMDYYLIGGMNLGVGAEYCYNDLIAARAGYNLSSDGILPSYASVGLGVKFSGFGLDAAYLLSGPLSGTISAGLRYAF